MYFLCIWLNAEKYIAVETTNSYSYSEPNTRDQLFYNYNYYLIIADISI